jgi:hypothetical protein
VLSIWVRMADLSRSEEISPLRQLPVYPPLRVAIDKDQAWAVTRGRARVMYGRPIFY